MNAPYSDAVRTTSAPPIFSSGCIRTSEGGVRTTRSALLSSVTANTAAIPNCAITVPQRRADQPPMQAVDEQQLQRDVDDVRRDDHDQRPAQVADAALIALPRHRDQRARKPDAADPQKRRRHRTDATGPAEHADRDRRQRGGERCHRHADQQRHPQRLRRDCAGAVAFAGAVEARDLGRDAVDQEIAERRQRVEQRARERQRRQLRGAEVADDRGVDQQVQRFGGERAERGQRQREDLPVQRRWAQSPPRPLHQPVPDVRQRSLRAIALRRLLSSVGLLVGVGLGRRAGAASVRSAASDAGAANPSEGSTGRPACDAARRTRSCPSTAGTPSWNARYVNTAAVAVDSGAP